MEVPDNSAGAGSVAALIEQARAGSVAAVGVLFQRCRPYLLQVANAQINMDLQAKAGGSDLVQQTLLEAQRDLHQFQGTTEAELLAWLRGILANNISNFVRHYRGTAKRQVGRELSLDADGSSEVRLDPALTAASPEEDLLRVDRLAALRGAIDRLPDDYRDVILRRYERGETFPVIGAALGRSAEAVRKLWARAVLQLQRELEAEG